jgi:hypothetical protein
LLLVNLIKQLSLQVLGLSCRSSAFSSHLHLRDRIAVVSNLWRLRSSSSATCHHTRGLRDSFDGSVIDKAVNNLLESLITLDHVNDESSLEVSVVLNEVLLERLVAVSNSNQETVPSDFKIQSLRSNQVKVGFDVFDWNCNLHLIDIVGEK